jgi:hypothetical protein
MASEDGEAFLTATIELEGLGGPSSWPDGRLVVDGAVFEFHGWLGLSLALGEAVEAAERRREPSRDAETSSMPETTSNPITTHGDCSVDTQRTS